MKDDKPTEKGRRLATYVDKKIHAFVIKKANKYFEGKESAYLRKLIINDMASE